MDKKPNIIFILADDQGAWATHCGGNQEIITPNLDYIAENGLRFDNFFCASPVCSPARASIMTGMIPSQHGIHDWIKSGNLERETLGDKRDDPYYRNEEKATAYLEGTVTYTDILAEHGYTCALSGKWHLGDSRRPQHGFTKWFTIGRGGCLYNRADVVEDGDLRYETRYITDVLTDKALEYMDQLGDAENPYYLSVHYTAPHDPWDEDQHPAEYVDMYKDCPFLSAPELPIHPNQIPSAPTGVGEKRKSLLKGYYSAITAMDANVGRILNKLRERGELESTLVVFTGDNGMNMGHHGIWGKGNGTFPFNMYDTAVKVPFMLSWPDELPKGRVVERMHSHYDWIHTLIELLGIGDASVPELLPGRSFVSSIYGSASGVDQDDGNIVIFDEYGPSRMIRTREWKYIRRYPYGPDELYHLMTDPGELKDLAGVQEWEDVRKMLKEKMENWYCRYADPKVDGSRERVTGFGQLCRAGVYAEGAESYAK